MATYSFDETYVDKATLCKDRLLLLKKLKYFVTHLAPKQRIIVIICAEDIQQIGGQDESKDEEA
jgi:hypothetical protein